MKNWNELSVAEKIELTLRVMSYPRHTLLHDTLPEAEKLADEGRAEYGRLKGKMAFDEAAAGARVMVIQKIIDPMTPKVERI